MVSVRNPSTANLVKQNRVHKWLRVCFCQQNLFCLHEVCRKTGLHYSCVLCQKFDSNSPLWIGSPLKFPPIIYGPSSRPGLEAILGASLVLSLYVWVDRSSSIPRHTRLGTCRQGLRQCTLDLYMPNKGPKIENWN